MCAAGPNVMLVCCLWKIHERLVVRNVVTHGRDSIVSRQTCMVLAANGAPQSIDAGWREAALEPSPSDAFSVEQVAHILTGHGDLICVLKFGIGEHAIIEERPRIADHRSGGCAVRNVADRI